MLQGTNKKILTICKWISTEHKLPRVTWPTSSGWSRAHTWEEQTVFLILKHLAPIFPSRSQALCPPIWKQPHEPQGPYMWNPWRAHRKTQVSMCRKESQDRKHSWTAIWTGQHNSLVLHILFTTPLIVATSRNNCKYPNTASAQCSPNTIFNHIPTAHLGWN